jgi:rhodanese-related sulfurtransferase
MNHMTASEVAEWLDDPTRPDPILLDVREQWEFETASIPGSTLVPMSVITSRFGEVEALADGHSGTQNPIVCICHHGSRSLQVAGFLEAQGLTGITNMTGGIHAWSLQVDRDVPVY